MADFEWDPMKAEANLRKHRVTFDFATNVFSDPNCVESPDPEDHEGEERWLGIGQAQEFVLVVVFTLRQDVIRIISARRADRYEYIRYWTGEIQA